MWLPNLDLYKHDKAILESSQWLNDGIIYAAQRMLQAQTKGHIFGWQSTQLSKQKGLFSVVPSSSSFVQLLHINDCHWVTTSNVNVHGGACYPDTVCVYDSERPSTVHPDITRIVCSFFKCQSSQLRIDIMNVFMQPNCNDCGIYAIANATELACGADPVRCNWDLHIMRQHLIECFENGVLTVSKNRGEACTTWHVANLLHFLYFVFVELLMIHQNQ